jgi:hypothetical protein
MKQTGISGLSILLLLFASCGKQMEDEIGGSTSDLRLAVALVDQDLQDRLDPESPAYFGDEYVRGIKVLYPYKGKKITDPVLNAYAFKGQMDMSHYTTIYTTINPPHNPLGYYFMLTAPSLFADDTYVYIRYPDGSEDEVKVLIYERRDGRSKLVLIDKVWFNDELACDLQGDLQGTGPDYYNPNYYPVLEPILDDEGKPMGEHVRPLGALNLIVVVKEDAPPIQ